ncbi:MAG: OmpA family protein [Pseudomonadota bacterium]
MRTAGRIAGLLIVGLLAGCATRDRVVLLPGGDGKVGKVMVQSRSSDRQVLLDTAYGEAQTSSQGGNQAAVIEPAAVQRDFGEVLAAMPQRPMMVLLNFEGDSTALDAGSRARLPEVLASIASRPAPEVVLVGHTDRAGTPQYNDKLGMDRAVVVRDALVAIGLKPRDISVTSRGEREPLVTTPDDVSEPQNRRVEVIVR